MRKTSMKEPDLIIDRGNLFKVGTINYLDRYELPGMIEVVGTHFQKPYLCGEDKDMVRIPYVVKIAVRTPTWNGRAHLQQHNQAHLYRWYDFVEVKKGNGPPYSITQKDITDSLDFMLFEAGCAYDKMGYNFDFTTGPDGSKMAKYILGRLAMQSRGFLKGNEE